MPIENGNKVKLEYTGTLEDGTVFDSSEKHGQPLEFEVGAKQMIPGFEKNVLGMEKGQENEFTLQSADAYGDPNPQLIKKLPRDKLPEGDLKPGTVLGMQLPDGQQMPARIAEIDEKEVTLDLNHPLAGKVLHFKIKVVDVS